MSFAGSVKGYFGRSWKKWKRRAKRIVLAAPFWVLLAGIALTAFGIGRYAFLTDRRYDQRMASFWTSDSQVPYRHMSVYGRGSRSGGDVTASLYVNEDISLSRSDILVMRSQLQNAADSGTPRSNKDGQAKDGRPRGWEDCFSSWITGNIATVPEADAVNPISINTDVQIIAVEGNFTAFHPFRFMSGGFIPETVEDNYQIVLNDVLAWRFFRSYDVLGNRVRLWDREFTVIGVVAEPSDSLSKSSGAQEPRAYICFAALEELAPTGVTGSVNSSGIAAVPGEANSTGVSASSSGSSSGRPELAILCYEAMLPELVRGVARTDMSTAVPNYSPADPVFYLISNTGRFTIPSSWKFMWPIGKTQSFLSAYEFPYWEKTAQLTSQHLFADMCITGIGAVTIFSGVIMAALRYRRKLSSKRNIRPAPQKYNTV